MAESAGLETGEEVRLVGTDAGDDERVVESALRPKRLAEFVGQRVVREQLSLLLAAARRRGSAPDHLLLSGPPGLGKTTLAMIVAHELGVPLRVTSGPAITHAGDLAAVLAQPGGAIWVGGSAPNSSHGRSALVERWNGRTWTNLSPPATPSRHDAAMTDLAGAGRGALWGIGITQPLTARFWHYAHGAWAPPVSPRWYPYWLAGVPHTTSVWAVGSSTSLNDAVIALAGPLPR